MDIPQESYLFSLSNARFNALQPENGSSVHRENEPKPFRPIKNTETHFSTGSKDLDALLGGGLKKGTRLLLELGKHLGPDWHQPLTVSISCNFIANGGCCMVLPTAGATLEMVQQERLNFLPRRTVESSLRIADFGNMAPKDTPFFQLDPTSTSKAFERFVEVQEKLARVDDRRRPVLTIVGIDTVEMVYGDDAVGVYQRGAVMTKSYGDVLLYMAKHSTRARGILADLADVHLKLDEINGALVLYSLKPPSRLHHVRYDYDKGYPSVTLTPIT